MQFNYIPIPLHSLSHPQLSNGDLVYWTNAKLVFHEHYKCILEERTNYLISSNFHSSKIRRLETENFQLKAIVNYGLEDNINASGIKGA